MTEEQKKLVTELIGRECQCGSLKKPRYTFCVPCYRKLPGPLQVRLYKRVGDGYEEAHFEAMEILRGER